jgi:hypothetical protein
MVRLAARDRVDRVLKASAIVAAALAVRWVPTCAFLSMTGLPCPMCGGTRSAACLVRGDLTGAWDWNAPAIGWIIVAAALGTAWVLEAMLGMGINYPTWWTRACWVVLFGLAAVTLAAWAARLAGIAFPWPEVG